MEVVYGAMLIGLLGVITYHIGLWMGAKARKRKRRRKKRNANPPERTDADVMPRALVQLLHIEATYEVTMDPRSTPDELLLAGTYVLVDPGFDPWSVTGMDRAPRVEIEVDDDPFSCGVATMQDAPTVHMHLVTFDIAARTDDILEALSAHYLRPGTATELLALGAMEMEYGLRQSVLALGSPYRKDGKPARFAAIKTDDDGKTLGFGSQDPDGRWEGTWRILALDAPRPDQPVADAT